MKILPLNKFANSKSMSYVFFIAVAFFVLMSNKTVAQRIPWNAPQVAKDVKNPLSGEKTALIEGKSLYMANCAPCHGDKGTGNGPAAQALTPKPADHSSAVVQSETDGSLFWKLSEGRNPMPSYKKILTDKQRWELVDYIRTLAKAGK
ncbi:c-type cytochrome [Mucilaginibacter flavidus]|uniref:c-type cytochrome n=1 Tax=Mucilaginibacter flavidus TaxID=2949309 RepID=UPI002093E59F|nr:cytochrome c [Mucilaginibacter flavidus]MCO5948460.1 c-type cytochrome [Mucilaginibacter flavidus]